MLFVSFGGVHQCGRIEMAKVMLDKAGNRTLIHYLFTVASPGRRSQVLIELKRQVDEMAAALNQKDNGLSRLAPSEGVSQLRHVVDDSSI